MGRDGILGSHGNKICPHRPAHDAPIVRKVRADSVPFGDSISINGRTVWAAYNPDGELVAVAATAKEVRKKYSVLRARQSEAMWAFKRD